MYGFRKVARGSETGCFMHPYFVRGHPELLKLMKRRKAPPICSSYYQARVYKGSYNAVGEKEGYESDYSFSEISEPEMVQHSRLRGRKRRVKQLPYDITPAAYKPLSQNMVKRGKRPRGDDGTRGKTEEEMILSKGLCQKRGGRGKHRFIPVKEGGGVEGEPKVVDGAKRAEIEVIKATGSGETSFQPICKKIPPGCTTASTNSSGGYNPHYNHWDLHLKAHELTQQSQLGKWRWNGGSGPPPLQHRSSSYTDLLDHLQADSENSLSRQRKTEIQPPFGDSEEQPKNSLCSHHSSLPYSRPCDTSYSLLELMEVADSLETRTKCSEPIQSIKHESENAENMGCFVSCVDSLSNRSSSTLFDLAEVADTLSIQRPSSKLQQVTRSIKDMVENEHLYMTEEPQFEQQQQHDASAFDKDMSTTHDVAKAEQKPNLLNAISRAIFTSFSRMKMRESSFQQRQQCVLSNASAIGMGDKARQGYKEQQVYPSFSKNHFLDSSASVAHSRGGASRSTTQNGEPDNRYPEAPLGGYRSFSEPMRSSSSGDPQNISDVDMAPSILLKLRSALGPNIACGGPLYTSEKEGSRQQLR